MTDQILPDDDRAATYRTDIKGWVGRDGLYYGQDEALARYGGATHIRCEKCGDIRAKNSYCSTCYERRQQEQWEAIAPEPWDGESMFYDSGSDHFFSSMEEAAEHYECSDLSASGFRPHPCRPVFYQELDPQAQIDGLMLDEGDPPELPQILLDKFQELNQMIAELKIVLCWDPVRKRRLDLVLELEEPED